MSAAAYREPYMIPAGVLTLAVHAAFFALLFLGFTWQTLPPAVMQVELWESLPEEQVAPMETVAPPPAPKIEEAVRPSPPPIAEKVKAPDIALPDKKKEKTKPIEKAPEKKKPVAKSVETKPVEKVRQKPEAAVTDQQGVRGEPDQAAENKRLVIEFQDKIRNKIRRNIVMPPNVPNGVVAIFSVTLLPGGSVLPPKLLQSSGNPAYDSAVERAILKSDPLPLPPPEKNLFNQFRELKLMFRPEE